MPDQLAARTRGVSHRYRGATPEPALRGVDLDIEAGSVTALIGANGSGKTTLLRVLAAILRPTEGEVQVLGAKQPTGLTSGAARRLRRRVGYVSQGAALDPDMTGAETLWLLAALYGVPRGERRGRVAKLADAFGLAPWLERRIDAISGGQRRRLHLAGGMIHDPELLCLDEPTAGLDPDGRACLWAELERRAARGGASVIVTHDLAAAQRHAHRVAILDRGSTVGSGRPQELIAEHPPDLAEVYRCRTGRDLSDLAPTRRKR